MSLDDRDWTVAPGATLDEWRQEHGTDVATMAERLFMTAEQYDGLVVGRYVITPTLADRLECVTGIPATLWLNLERTYREDLRLGRVDFG